MPKNLGFTLIELLVVISIIAILVTILLPQLSKFNQAQSLANTASNLVSNIRVAQNNAVSGQSCDATGLQKATKWDVVFPQSPPQTYQIVAECGDQTITPAPAVTYALPSGVTFGQAYPDNDPAGCAFDPNINFKIMFNSISGTISYSGQTVTHCATDISNKITIPLIAGSSTTKIVIDKGGSVYVQ